MRENPNGFRVHRLNRSATVSVVVYTSGESNPGRKYGKLSCYHYTTSVDETLHVRSPARDSNPESPASEADTLSIGPTRRCILSAAM